MRSTEVDFEDWEWEITRFHGAVTAARAFTPDTRLEETSTNFRLLMQLHDENRRLYEEAGVLRRRVHALEERCHPIDGP